MISKASNITIMKVWNHTTGIAVLVHLFFPTKNCLSKYIINDIINIFFIFINLYSFVEYKKITAKYIHAKYIKTNQSIIETINLWIGPLNVFIYISIVLFVWLPAYCYLRHIMKNEFSVKIDVWWLFCIMLWLLSRLNHWFLLI